MRRAFRLVRLSVALLAIWFSPWLMAQDSVFPIDVDGGPHEAFSTHPDWAADDPWLQQVDLADAGRELWGWELMPEGLLYKSYIAGVQEPRLGSAFVHEKGDQTFWDSTLGGRVGLARFGTKRGVQPEGFQIDVEGAAILRMQPQEDRDVRSVDFRAGVPLTYREGPFQAKLAYYHTSSHLGDEFLLKNPTFDRLNYSRDALVLGVGYFLLDPLRVYAEIGWSFYGTGGDKPWEFQSGFEWSENRPTTWRGQPFFSTNVHLRETVDWGGSINVRTGWEWRGPESDHVFRAGLQYFNGKNAQYSFLQDSQQLLGLGIWYDF